MTGDCHVRICESGGLGCSPPLDSKKHSGKKHHSKKTGHNRGGSK
jgi:hypothetical protein